MKMVHDCYPPSRKIPLEAAFAEWVWKCPKCKQRWRIRQHVDGGRKSVRIGRMRWMRVPA